MSEMLVLSLTMTILGSAISLLVGGVIGWIARQVTYENTPQTVYAHPEMFDQNGNLMPDEIVAVRFEKNDVMVMWLIYQALHPVYGPGNNSF